MKTRESRYVTVARLAYQTAQASLPRYSHRKHPQHFILPQLAQLQQAIAVDTTRFRILWLRQSSFEPTAS